VDFKRGVPKSLDTPYSKIPEIKKRKEEYKSLYLSGMKRS
jgi:hypothetical protein